MRSTNVSPLSFKHSEKYIKLYASDVIEHAPSSGDQTSHENPLYKTARENFIEQIEIYHEFIDLR